MASRHRITQLLLSWYERGHRDLPWRRSSDPYRIWVSEIMLQQTRAQAVIPYYERFLERFPTVTALADAREDDVLALWAGLGYYSRARNLWRAAKEIATTGGFPRSYQAIRALPGIGDYTAAAIASIAFGLPHAAVDGNVLRVVARVENDAADIGAPRTRQRFREIAQTWLDQGKPGDFNQAMMELGATVCLPRGPLCLLCPVAPCCQGRQAGNASQLPVKLRKLTPVKLERTLFLIRKGTKVLLRRHEADARYMAGFWDLPDAENLSGVRAGEILGEFRHTITHHHYRISVRAGTLRSAGGNRDWFDVASLVEIPLSTTARKALRLAGIL